MKAASALGSVFVARSAAHVQARRLRPNPSIERTPYGTLRVPPVAAHVER
jgi:hypothetical protein